MSEAARQPGCRLTTRSAVYFTRWPLDLVEHGIKTGGLIPVRDDNDHECWLNPAAISTVQEEEE